MKIANDKAHWTWQVPLLPLLALLLSACGEDKKPAEESAGDPIQPRHERTDGNGSDRSKTRPVAENPPEGDGESDPEQFLEDLIATLERGEFVSLDSLKESTAPFSIAELEVIADGMPIGQAFKQMMIIIGERQATENPEACIEWLASLPDVNTSSGAHIGVASALAEKNPALVFESIPGIDNPILKNSFASAALSRWAGMETDGSFENARTLLKDHGKSLFDMDSQLGLFAMAKTNHQQYAESLEFLGAIKTEGIAFEGAAVARDLGIRWAVESPAEAGAWLKENGENPLAANVAEVVAKQWATNNAPKVSEWLVELPESPVKDQAIAGFANQIYRDQPMMALDWVVSISDEALKKKVANALGSQVTVQMEEARAYAEKLGLR